MSLLSDLQQQLVDIQAKITILQNTPEDIYSFGTVVRVAYDSNNSRYHLMKNGEESWVKLPSTTGGKQLREWILEAHTSNIGYFELYVLNPDVAPLYTSA